MSVAPLTSPTNSAVELRPIGPADRDEAARIVGSNFIDERVPVRGVGPITVDPAVQGRVVGRALMQAVLDRGAGALGTRLLQDAFNAGSLSLYASLGFDVAEPVALMSGRPRGDGSDGTEVRPLEPSDLGIPSVLY
jgi:GNAT superfamily N-acetyltransferase